MLYSSVPEVSGVAEQVDLLLLRRLLDALRVPVEPIFSLSRIIAWSYPK